MALAAWSAAALAAGCNVERYEMLPDGEEDAAAAEDGVAGDADPPDADGAGLDDIAGDVPEDGPVACAPGTDAGDASAGCPAGLACCEDEGEGICVDLDVHAEHCGACGEECDAGEVCDAGDCECLPGLVDCEGGCFSLADDPEHCGACDVGCEADEDCVSGRCVP